MIRSDFQSASSNLAQVAIILSGHPCLFTLKKNVHPANEYILNLRDFSFLKRFVFLKKNKFRTTSALSKGGFMKRE